MAKCWQREGQTFLSFEAGSLPFRNFEIVEENARQLQPLITEILEGLRASDVNGTAMDVNLESVFHEYIESIERISENEGARALWNSLSQAFDHKASTTYASGNINVRLHHGHAVAIAFAPSRPMNAERLAYFFLPRDLRANLLGDLEEEFPDMVDKLGVRGARSWFWKEVGAAIAMLNANRLLTAFDRICVSLARLRKSQ